MDRKINFFTYRGESDTRGNRELYAKCWATDCIFNSQEIDPKTQKHKETFGVAAYPAESKSKPAWQEFANIIYCTSPKSPTINFISIDTANCNIFKSKTKK